MIIPSTSLRKKILAFADNIEGIRSKIKKIIFIPTIQSTGTWFCLDLFKEHSQVSWIGPRASWNLEQLEKAGNNDIWVIHIHFGIVSVADRFVFVNKDAIVQQWCKNADATIVPIRDPLLSLLTAYTRYVPSKNFMDLTHIVNGFCELIKLIQKYDIFILPIDIYSYKNTESKLAILKRLFDFVELPHESFLIKWAKDWPIKNTVGQSVKNHVANLYKTKNISEISKMIPKEYAYLKSKEDVLKPFLQKHGYKDLIWWNK